jgi:hypothetical protein
MIAALWSALKSAGGVIFLEIAMYFRPLLAGVATLSLCLAPAAAFAQNVAATGSPLPDQPYTLIHPEAMTVSGEVGGAVTINHPDAPLQCVLTVVPVEDTGWTAENALAALDDAAVSQSWSETFPGFVLTNKTTTAYQSDSALLYEGTSTDSPQGVPLTIVHTETVNTAHGYTLDCFYATEVAEQARPLVDFIIANFSTQQDAEPVTPLP